MTAPTHAPAEPAPDTASRDHASGDAGEEPVLDDAAGDDGVDPVPDAASDDECVDVRVWDLPVRIIHWTIAGCIGVLAVTGFYIADPFVFAGSGPAYLMGKVRAVHLITGWVFVAAVLARIAWAFRGTRWARWDQFIPVHRERRRLVLPSIKFYLFVRREPPEVVGHNPLAGLTYTVLYLMFLVQIVTGIALEQLAVHDGWLWNLTGWVFTIAPIPIVRLVHHMIMWLTLGFVVHHVYSAVLMDVTEHSGLVSSMITGTKRLPRGRVTASGELPDDEREAARTVRPVTAAPERRRPSGSSTDDG